MAVFMDPLAYVLADIINIYLKRLPNETFLCGTIPVNGIFPISEPNHSNFLWTFHKDLKLHCSHIFIDLDQWIFSTSTHCDKPYLCMIRGKDPNKPANI